MDALVRDLRFAVRGLWRTPGFTAAAVLALALGIGPTGAIFTVVDGVLLKPLGYRQPDRLVTVFGNFPGQGLLGTPNSIPELLDLRARGLPFESVAAWDHDSMALSGGDRPERLSVARVTGNFLETLGVRPLLGRGFTLAEEDAGKDNVALLSHALWMRRFSGDPAVVGRTITLDLSPRTIVGVLPPGFFFRGSDDVAIPLGITPMQRASRGWRSWEIVARLRPGLSLPDARRGLEALAAELRRENPRSYGRGPRSWAWTLEPLSDRFFAPARPVLFLLLGAVAFVLLIACANVANLLLARAAARQRELAIFSALGAGRARLVRQLLTESALLAALGGAAGLVLALWGLDALLAAAPESLPRAAAVRMDGRVLAFAAAVCMATTFLFGLAPAVHASRIDLARSIKEGAHGGTHGGRLRSMLVVAEISLALLLLIGAGLLLRTFASVTQVRPGFEPAGAAVAQVTLGGKQYETVPGVSAYLREALRRLSQLPGVEAAGASDILPMSGQSDWSFELEGFVPPTREQEPDDQFREITAGYFRALRVPLLRGRDFTDADDAKAPFVIVVNEAWVRRHLPGQDPIGHRIRFGSTGWMSAWRTVVGVVADVRDFGLDLPARPVYYAPYQQMNGQNDVRFVVRGQVEPAQVESVVASVDPSQAIYGVTTLEKIVEHSVRPRRFPLQLLGLFAGIALLLAAIGIYGVISYGVTQRSHEIGLRMAVGARAADVLRLVVGQGVKLAGLGVVLGLLLALALARLMSGMLYGVSARDPLTYVAISLLLALVALFASLLPALRATRVDPMTALRAE